MKIIMLVARVIVAYSAYAISFILLQNTFIFNEFLKKTASTIETVVVINLVIAFLIVLAYLFSGNILKVVGSICILFSSVSIVAHSKLLDRMLGFRIESYLSANITSLLLFIMVMLLLTGSKLKRTEGEWDALVAAGVVENDVKVILKEGVRAHLIFVATVSMLFIILWTIAFAAVNVKGSNMVAILSALIGVSLFTGCIIFIYRKWSSKVDI